MLHDVAVFFTDFAVDAIYTPQDDVSQNIKVIFDIDYQQDSGVSTSVITATCKTQDVASAKHGDMLEVSGETYYIIEVMPDGTGITTLALSRDMYK